MNPLTNDFDEALINASWGVGEALVSGDITPDTVIVNKVTGAVIEQRLGDKGGERSAEACLADAQISELTDTVMEIETLFADPVDVEWAICNGELHILQARPITAYIPLAKEMQTEPGAQRVLYMDGALTDGLTISGPISPMTGETFDWIYRLMAGYMLGIPAHELILNIDQTGFGFHGARIYVNLSMFLHLMGKGERLAKTGRVNERVDGRDHAQPGSRPVSAG